jgi:hypothetical protein
VHAAVAAVFICRAGRQDGESGQDMLYKNIFMLYKSIKQAKKDAILTFKRRLKLTICF